MFRLTLHSRNDAVLYSLFIDVECSSMIQTNYQTECKYSIETWRLPVKHSINRSVTISKRSITALHYRICASTNNGYINIFIMTM